VFVFLRTVSRPRIEQTKNWNVVVVVALVRLRGAAAKLVHVTEEVDEEGGVYHTADG
jgi:hypothetical protein